MKSAVSCSIEAMERVYAEPKGRLWLFIDKGAGCLAVTADKNCASPLYEIADWVQFLTNKPSPTESPKELARLHRVFQKLWELYISEISVSK